MLAKRQMLEAARRLELISVKGTLEREEEIDQSKHCVGTMTL